MKLGENKAGQVVLAPEQVEFPKGPQLWEHECSPLRAVLAKMITGETAANAEIHLFVLFLLRCWCVSHPPARLGEGWAQAGRRISGGGES